MPATTTAKPKSVSKSEKCGLIFPVARVNRTLKASGMKRVGGGAPVYLTAVAEYVTAELMDVAGRLCKDRKRKTISVDDISSAMRADAELARVFAGFGMCIGDRFARVADALELKHAKSGKGATAGA